MGQTRGIHTMNWANFKDREEKKDVGNGTFWNLFLKWSWCPTYCLASGLKLTVGEKVVEVNRPFEEGCIFWLPGFFSVSQETQTPEGILLPWWKSRVSCLLLHLCIFLYSRVIGRQSFCSFPQPSCPPPPTAGGSSPFFIIINYYYFSWPTKIGSSNSFWATEASTVPRLIQNWLWVKLKNCHFLLLYPQQCYLVALIASPELAFGMSFPEVSWVSADGTYITHKCRPWVIQWKSLTVVL